MFLFYVHTKLFQKGDTIQGGHYLRKYSILKFCTCWQYGKKRLPSISTVNIRRFKIWCVYCRLLYAVILALAIGVNTGKAKRHLQGLIGKYLIENTRVVKN